MLAVLRFKVVTILFGALSCSGFCLGLLLFRVWGHLRFGGWLNMEDKVETQIEDEMKPRGLIG